jgi:hypothetical protein
MEVMVLSVVVAWLNATDEGGQTLPMISIFVASSCRVRSGLTVTHESPRSSLRYSRSPP